jgi:hypothetical protein
VLHALLHGKLDESVPEPQRLEDALTSTVFGTLVWVNAWNTLTRWLRVPPLSEPENPACSAWFWPRLAFSEPDVLLRLGKTLIVVEAKYRSGRHDRMALNAEAELSLCNQLELQHRCIATPRDRRRPYEVELEHAIQECELVHAFVVDRRRLRRATRELEEAKLLLPETRFHLVTWQELWSSLSQDAARTARWAIDLLAYLQLTGLDAFSGVTHPEASPEFLISVARWRAPSDRRELRAALRQLAGGRQSLAPLFKWRSA